MSGSLLRTATLTAAAVVAATSFVMWSAGHTGAGPVALWSGIILAALLVERWRYRAGMGSGAEADWQPTGERYLDPGSGEPMEVLYNPRTGERRYRRERS